MIGLTLLESGLGRIHVCQSLERLINLSMEREVFMNDSFTDKRTEYIVDLIGSGDYRYTHESLRIEIEKGWNSADSKRDVKDIIANRMPEGKL